MAEGLSFVEKMHSPEEQARAEALADKIVQQAGGHLEDMNAMNARFAFAMGKTHEQGQWQERQVAEVIGIGVGQSAIDGARQPENQPLRLAS